MLIRTKNVVSLKHFRKFEAFNVIIERRGQNKNKCFLLTVFLSCCPADELSTAKI